jgi:uncharacterized protein
VITNTSKGTLICKEFTNAHSLLQKARGLMFRKSPIPMLFHNKTMRRTSLHMMFVWFAIDVVYLNNEKTVVEIYPNFQPWSFYTPKHKAKFILELPNNSIHNTNTTIGDILTWREQ